MIRKALYLLQRFPLYQWMRGVRELGNKVRLSPSALLLGRGRSFSFGRGTKIGARSRLQALDGGSIRLGEKVWISSDVEMETGLQIIIGSGTTIQRRCTINGATRIGANCILAPNVFISSGTHPFREIPHLPIREQERRLSGGANALLDKGVWIQDDCWLGTNVVVCPGVTIGKGSVIGANTVVTRDVAPYTVIAGSPGRVIGKRLKWEPPAAFDASREEDQIYVLSNSLASGGGRGSTHAIVSRREPLHVAIAASALVKGLRLYYDAPEETRICIEGSIYQLKTGLGVLNLTPNAITSALDYALCRIFMEKNSRSDSLAVLRLVVRNQ